MLISKIIFLFACQIFLIYLILAFTLKRGENWEIFPPSQWIVAERFVVCIVLHEHLNRQSQHGMKLMKYALNHPWKFKNWGIAFFMGFLQSFVIFWVEFVNLTALLTLTDSIEIVQNFIAMEIIAQFDNFTFNSLVNPNLKQILENKMY